MTQEVHSWVVIDDLAISITRPGASQDSIWHSFVQDLSAKRVTRLLATSVGTVQVNSVQRKIVADMLKSRNIRVAAVTDDRIARGLLTAVIWLGASIKPFPWAQLREAITYLDVPPPGVDKVVDAVSKLKGD